MAKKPPKAKRVARQSAKAMAKKAGGSRRSGRIAGRAAAQSVGRGRVKSEDEFKDARAIGTAAGAEASAVVRVSTTGVRSDLAAIVHRGPAPSTDPKFGSLTIHTE